MYNIYERFNEEYNPLEYDYNLVEFVSLNKKVTITCPEHGPFDITPTRFLYQRGCMGCKYTHERGLPKRKRKQTLPKPPPAPTVGATFYIHTTDSNIIVFGVTKGCVKRKRMEIESRSRYKHTLNFTKYFECEKTAKAINKTCQLLLNRMEPLHPSTQYSKQTADGYNLELIKKIVMFFD